MPWKSVPHATRITSTQRASFPEYPFMAPPKPIIPRQQTVVDRDSKDALSSTYRESFRHCQPMAREPIRPVSGYEWPGAGKANKLPRSTSMDSYLPPPRVKQVRSLPPVKGFTPSPHAAGTLHSTASSHFVPHGNMQRMPIVPRANQLFYERESPAAGRVPRSTMADSYQGNAGRARMPILPRSNGRVYGADIAADFQTTSRSSFVAHTAGAYIMAHRPPDVENVW